MPADSADCYLNGDSVIMLNGKTFQENYNEDLDLARLHLAEYPHYIPCWSVGRLIEIYCILVGAKEFKMHIADTLVEEIIYLLNAIKIDGADFSKLEE